MRMRRKRLSAYRRAQEHGLVNTQWGVPLGLGLAVVHASLAVDVREASRRAARDLRQLRAALQTAQSRSTEMERQVALADAAARAEAGKARMQSAKRMCDALLLTHSLQLHRAGKRCRRS
jgi:hypothetical protein